MDTRRNLGKILRQRRLTLLLPLRKVATLSGISPSHLGRIERGERFPSASVLRKIARPLGFEENELFALAGYLSSTGVKESETRYNGQLLDPYTSYMLSQEPVEVQRAVIGILNILKTIARALKEEKNNQDS